VVEALKRVESLGLLAAPGLILVQDTVGLFESCVRVMIIRVGLYLIILLGCFCCL
jgi:hypothetical protein